MKYSIKNYPDKDGFYGKYGGRFLSPMNPILSISILPVSKKFAAIF